MALPCTVLSSAKMKTPFSSLPEMRLPAAPVVPAIVFSREEKMFTPWPPLPRSAVPAALGPMRLPSTLFPVAPPTMLTPIPALPEMTLPAPAAVPPIVLFVAPSMITPLKPLPRAAVPSAFVPT